MAFAFDPVSARTSVDFPLDKSVGPLRAGQFCLPKGSVRGKDFVADEGQFDLMVRQVLDEQSASVRAVLGTGAAPRIDLHFKAVGVKFCAKSWGIFGMGDTKALSGDAEFTFAWRRDGQPSMSIRTFTLKVNPKDHLTAPAIMRRAIAVAVFEAAAIPR